MIISKHIIWRALGNETVFLDAWNGHYFTLNETGSEIWQMLNSGESIENIAQSLA